jgi:hypothetical protein
MKDDSLIKVNSKIFNQLMNADRELINEFRVWSEIDSNKNGLNITPTLKSELIKIQKNLFNLQVKIIFSKLKKVSKDVDITPLLSVINKKIFAMNNYMEEQEKEIEIEKSGSSNDGQVEQKQEQKQEQEQEAVEIIGNEDKKKLSSDEKNELNKVGDEVSLQPKSNKQESVSEESKEISETTKPTFDLNKIINKINENYNDVDFDNGTGNFNSPISQNRQKIDYFLKSNIDNNLLNNGLDNYKKDEDNKDFNLENSTPMTLFPFLVFLKDFLTLKS